MSASQSKRARKSSIQSFIPLFIIAAGLVAYQNSFSGALVFDDSEFWANNVPALKLWPPWDILGHSWRPVVYLSFAMNYAMGGLNLWGYHFFNLAVHILAGLTLYGVVRRTLISERLRERWGNAASWLGGATAAIWLVHPIQTESVTYIWQRCESLMGLFYLLTLYCVSRSANSTRSLWWQAGAVVSCVLGMATKEVMVTAPVVVVLYDRIFLAKSWREVGRRRWALHACLAATWLVLFFVASHAPSEYAQGAGFAHKTIPPLAYALTQAGVVVHYVRLAFWPAGLCLDHGWGYGWPVVNTIADAMPGLVVIGGLLAATGWALYRKPALGFLGAWFFFILAPTSSVMPIGDVIYEHRMYLSLAAVVTMTVVGAFLLGKRVFSKQPKSGRWLTGSVCVSVVVILSGLTIQRNLDYRSELTIWKDTVNKCPGNPRAHHNLALCLQLAGQYQDAIPHYAEALRIKPDYVEAYNGLGITLDKAGKPAEAVPYFEKAMQINPGYAAGHNNWGNALLHAGNFKAAIEQYQEALRLNPNYAEASFNIGVAFFSAGQYEDAIAPFEQALRIKPDYAEAHLNLATALVGAGKIRDAISHYEQALRINPHFTIAQITLANVLARVSQDAGGNPIRALALAQQACNLTGSRDPTHLDTLAIAYAANRRFNDAIRTSQMAIELAKVAGQTQLVAQIESRIVLYQSGQAYR